MVARADLQVTLTAIDRATPTVKQLESSIIRFVGAVSATIAALGAITFPIVQATRFDRAMRDVQKTTGFADDEIKQLGADLINLSRGLDQSAQSLAGIAAAAGQLGLGRQGAEAILAFSESVARASTTLDLSTDSAARASAKLLNIFQLPTQNVENLFSAINELSNTTTANAGELIDTVTRIGNTAKLSVTEVAALAATAIDLGVSAEVAGTSLVKVFSRIQSNAQGFADAIGVSLSEFTALPALDRFQQFLAFLSTQTDEVQANLITKLAGGGRIFALVNKLTNDAGNGFEVLNRNLTTSNTAFDSGLSAITEYQNISKALSVQLGILRNNFQALTQSVGQAFIPRLLELTRELTDFLQTPRAAAFFRGIGESARSFFDIMVRGVRIVANLDIEFRNLFAILKAIIALQFGRLLLGVTARLASTALALTGIGNAARLTRGPLGTILGTFFAFRGATGSAVVGLRAVQAQITGGILTAFRSLGGVLLRFIPIVGIAVTVLGGLFAFFGDEIKVIFNSVLDFFGFVSEEQADTLDAAKKSLDDDVVAFEKASASILSARKKIESGALDLSEETFAAIIERDVLKLNEAVAIAQERIKVLGELAAAAATQSEVFARAAQRFLRASTVQLDVVVEKQQELAEATAEVIRLQQLAQQGVDTEGLGDVTGVDPQEIEAALEAQLAAEEAVNVAIAERGELLDAANRRRERSAELTAESVKAAEEQAEIFERIAGGLTEGIREAFVLEIDARQAELELATLVQELGELRSQLATVETLGGGDTLEAARLGVTIEDLAEKVDVYTKAAAIAKEETDDFVDSLTSAEQFEFSQAIPNLAKTAEGLEATRVALGQIDEAGLQSARTLQDAFNANIALLVREKIALDNVKEGQDAQIKSLTELAKAAKSVFDNTVTEVRALNRALINSVEEFSIVLQQRPLELKISVDTAALETELDTIEDRRKELESRLSEIEKEEQGSRLQGVFTFEKNKTKAELDELKTRQAAIEQQQAQNAEARLRAEFAAIEARTRDFLQRAQELAAQGNLDEALGLKELAKNQIPDLFKQLEDLSKLSTSGGQPLVSTENLEALVGQVQGLSREVQTDVAGINESLRDSTASQLETFKNTAKVTNERLSEINGQLELMAKNIEGFNKALPEIINQVRGGGVTGGIVAGDVDVTQGGISSQQTLAGIETAIGLGAGATEGLKDTIDNQGDITVGLTGAVADLSANLDVIARLGTQGVNRNASGGLISGKGTGTSDSIPAMLSNGEFVVNAATTRFYGSSFFKGLQSFARGGLAIPRFGVGGLVGGFAGSQSVIQAAGAGGAPVNIHLPSGDVVRLREGETDSQTVIRMFKREARKRGARGA